mgnify:CR=1 FL=1
MKNIDQPIFIKYKLSMKMVNVQGLKAYDNEDLPKIEGTIKHVNI